MRWAALLLLAAPAGASGLAPPPGAEGVSATETPLATHAVATAPFDGTAVPTETAEGRVTRKVWRIPATDLTTLQVLAPLRDELTAGDWSPLLDCDAVRCGGFDFRAAIDVLPAPEMFVSLTDYRYLSAARGDARADIVASRSGDAIYVQVTTVGVEEAPPTPTGPVRVASDIPADGIDAALRETGRAVLPDLAFPTGASDLPPGDYPSLAALADILADRPGLTLALVGHTDATGGMAPNLALSQRRAESARRTMIDAYGADPARVEARGIAYLAPLRPNATPEDRARNRRVEAVVSSTP